MVTSPKSYKQKLHPAFFELVELNREFEIRFTEIQKECDRKLVSTGPAPSQELQDEVGAMYVTDVVELMRGLDSKLLGIQSRYSPMSFNKLAYHYFDFSNHREGVDDKQRIVEYIHWERHGESLEKTKQSVAEGDIKALRRLHRTDEDNFRLFAKKGPIKNFQGDTVHRQLLELILCYETAPLSKEERADCADEYCACGKSHDPDALDKQYRRLKKQLKASESPREL